MNNIIIIMIIVKKCGLSIILLDEICHRIIAQEPNFAQILKFAGVCVCESFSWKTESAVEREIS